MRAYYVKVFRHLLSTTVLTGFLGEVNSCSQRSGTRGYVDRQRENVSTEKVDAGGDRECKLQPT